jgi:cytoskeletal protein CcmA (bactofilin family)
MDGRPPQSSVPPSPNVPANDIGGRLRAPRLYWGKYRAKVLDNVDLLQLGRLMVQVPTIPGEVLNWALPNTPYAGPQVGFFTLPPIGANVWVEFEGGNPNYPIWAGCFWTEGEVPVVPAIPEKKVWRTEFIEVELDDTPGEGGLSITVMPPLAPDVLKMTFNELGITMDCPPNSWQMSPEYIKNETPPAVLTQMAESVTLEIPATTVEITGELITIETADVNVTANVNITGPVEIEGNVEITGAVEIEGNVEITGAVEIEGNVEIAGAVEIEGNVEIAGAVEVEGNVNFVGAFEVEGDLNLLGAGEVEGNFAVLGVIEGFVVPPFIGIL